MNNVQSRKLSRYIRKCADLLHLRDWEIRLDLSESCRPGANASTYIMVNRKRARIVLSDDFWSSSVDDKKQTIAHELIHIHFASMDNYIRHDLRGVMRSDDLFRLFFDSYGNLYEYGVDGLADGLGKLLPDLEI